MRWEDFADLLACPETLEPLEFDAESARLRSPSGRAYEIRGGVPILLTDADRREFDQILAAQGRSMAQEYAAEPPPAPATPEAPGEYFPPMVLPQGLIDEAYARKGDKTRVLSVGGGPTRNSPREINLNMAPFREVDAVGNATRLPFRSNSVDAIWCNAVLEHVAGAPEAVKEMVRVVEPGGRVICLVPFMQPVHAYPLDFQRYTADGLAYLMRDLRILAKGQAVGPSYAMWELLTRYLNGPGMVCVPRWIRGIVRRTLLPALRRSAAAKSDWTGNPEHEVLASVVYCIGEKE
jgi:uncharacterized protein YbaR (Trm112 family)